MINKTVPTCLVVFQEYVLLFGPLVADHFNTAAHSRDDREYCHLMHFFWGFYSADKLYTAGSCIRRYI